MQRIFLTRAQYDRLVAHDPQFMRDNYPHLERKWTAGGVLVSGAWTAVENLARLARRAEAADQAFENSMERSESARWV